MYPFGVLNSVTFDNLDRYGCKVCYQQTYSTWTTSDDIRKCAGPYLFVGGRATASSTFMLGAFDTSAVIHTETQLNTPHLSNGVYWYFTQYKSFGFSRDANIKQSPGDILSTDGNARLSWHLDISTGGFRLGPPLGYPFLNFATDYMKAIYNCPA